MIQKIGLILLGAVFLLSGSSVASDYAHKLDTGDMTIAWTLDGDLIHMELSAETTGWVSIGIDPEDAMAGADIIIGAVRNDTVRIEDHFADRKRGHSPDEKLGGENQVMNTAGTETDGVTTLSFTRPVAAAEEWDKPINTSGKTRVMIAHGSRDSFIATHQYRAVYDIDFSTGEAVRVR
ncbi:MAG TPA: DOMON domain-containing protein [Desulfotignum sp.]|nr:DOMON domain-containing protein [Desulfotignum sp.]